MAEYVDEASYNHSQQDFSLFSCFGGGQDFMADSLLRDQNTHKMLLNHQETKPNK